MISQNSASRFPRIAGGKHRQPRRRASFKPQSLLLEDRCLLSGGVPVPTTNPIVNLSTIFWNGEPTPLNPSGMLNIPSPASVGAAKTITITNNGTGMIYPFLRGANSGVDPNATPKAPYDPQDLANHEFREYIGYTTADGAEYLGLPTGASIKIQVPLVLWDGDNLYLATDGTYLTKASVFNYDANASISIVGSSPVSGTTWVQDSKKFPAGDSAMVMFYYSGGQPQTLPNDAPAQLTEVTFRDPYLKQFINDPKQTFPLLNYDVSYVNNLVAPVSMEASHVPITYGNTLDKNVPPTYHGYKDFGWLATDRHTTTFVNAIDDFINNTGDASIKNYFGGKGWPQYYNPASADLDIPSGANLFDDSPLNVNKAIVHTSSYDSNQWLLTSAGPGPIAARAGGVPLTDPQATKLPLSLTADERPAFVQNMQSMLANGQEVDLTIAPSPTVLGRVDSYDDTDALVGVSVTNGGSGYTSAPTVTATGGGGSGANLVAFVTDGQVTGVGIEPNGAGSGYTMPPSITFSGGGGSGAAATAAIGGGTVTVTLSPGVNLPTGEGLSYVFSRPASDYAITDITNLWYSWAQYHVLQYQNFVPESINATLNHRDVDVKDKTVPGAITNEITLNTAPQVDLAVGMTVTATGIPAGTTILKIDGKQIFLSQIPAATTPASQDYTFSKPQPIQYDPQYTTPFTLTFGDEEKLNAKRFAGSVYETMAAEAVGLPPSPYLPSSMNLVAHVIKFYANLPGFDRPWGPTLVGEVRDVVKSVLRGVYDFVAEPDQSKWYPNPSTPTGGQDFNVYNLDPYVWFVHKVEGMSAYGFSVDDDVANPTATGPLLGPDGEPNHYPNNLQIGFGGTGGFGNPDQWFPTIPWGTITTMATIGVQPDGDFAGDSIITLDGPDKLTLYNEINNPGTGQVGAYVSGPGIVPGTTLIHKGPTSGLIPSIVLSQPATSSDTPVEVTITAGTPPKMKSK